MTAHESIAITSDVAKDLVTAAAALEPHVLAITNESSESAAFASLLNRNWLSRLAAMLSGSFLRKGFLSLVDQAVVSAVNFLTLVLLGRHVAHDSGGLAQQELGLYQLGFSVVLLAMCAQNALIAVPYAVFGNRMEGGRRIDYAGSTFVHQLLLATITSALLMFVGFGAVLGWGPDGFGKVAWLLVAVMPLITMREFVRRIAFAHLQVPIALLLDVVVAVLQLGGLFALKASGHLTAITTFITIGAACAMAAAAVGFSMRGKFNPERVNIWPDLVLNWSFGKWAFAGQAVYLLMVYGVSWLLAALESTEATGRYAACMSLVLVANPLLLGLNNFLSPHAIQTFHADGLNAMRRVLTRTMIVVCSVVGLLCAMLVFGGAALLAMIYNQRFEGAQQIVSVLSLNLFMYAISMSAENGLLAMSRPKAICAAHVIGLIVTMIAAVILIKTQGVLGAAIAGVIGQSVATLWKCLMLGVVVREHAGVEPAVQGELQTSS